MISVYAYAIMMVYYAFNVDVKMSERCVHDVSYIYSYINVTKKNGKRITPPIYNINIKY